MSKSKRPLDWAWPVVVLLAASLVVWGAVARLWGVSLAALLLLVWLCWRWGVWAGERRTETWFENLELLMVRLDREGRIVFCNRYLLELTGWSWPQVAGRNWFELFVPEEEGLRALFEQQMAQETIMPQHRNAIRTRSGELRQVVWRNALARDAHGRVVGATSIGQDITAIERAEEGRLRSERILHQIVETVQDVVLLTDAEMRIQYTTPSMYPVGGWRPEELEGRSVFTLLDPEQQRIFQRMIREATPQNHTNRARFSYQRPDGQRRILEASINFLFSAKGVFQGAVVGIRDVTEHYQAEQAVRESEQRLRELANSMRDVVMMLDPKGLIEYVTPSVRAALGYDPQELVGRSAFDFFEPEDHSWVLEAVRAAREGRRPLRLEYQHRHKDGSRVWLETQLDFVYDLEGNPIRMVLGARQIQDRREAEEQLRKSEQMLRQVTDAMQDIVLLTDENAIVRYITPSVQKVTGIHPQALVGRSAYELLDAEQSRRFKELSAAATPENPTAQSSFVFVCPDGRELYMEASIKFLFDEKGLDRGAVTGIRDLTERYRAEQAVRQSEQMLRQITDAMQDVVALTDPRGYFRYLTPSVERLLGYRPEQMLGQLAFDYLAPEDREKAMRLAEQSLAGAGSYQLEGRYRHAKGHYVWIDTLVTYIYDGEGRLVGSVVSGRDVTERRQAEEALREREYRLRQITNSIRDVVVLLDPLARVQYVTPSVEQILGYRPEELVGKPISMLAGKAQWAEIRRRGLQAIREKRVYSTECGCKHKDGHVVWIESLVNFVWDDAEALQGIVVGMRDISERKQQQAYVEYMAYHDELTKLPNRRALRRAAEELLSRASQREIPVSLLYLDLDNFKTVNDTLGHDVGDELLVEVSQVLSKQLRAEDMLARLGGDEFACILFNTDTEQARQVASRMSRAIRSALGAGNPAHKLPSLGVSVGIASFPKDGRTFVELLKVADIAMYQAKGSGSRVVVYDPAKSPYTEERLQFEAAMRKAVQEQQLQLLYQPIWHLRERRIEEAEALLCWPYQGTILRASEFVPLAEEVHLVEQMDWLALQKGLMQLKLWHERGYLYRLSINLSTQSLVQPEVMRELLALLKDAALDPQWLTLEVTESVLLREPEQARAALEGFKALGVQIAIDDFGSGYASLGYLRQLPLDRLKIDRSFISYLGTSVRDEKLIRAAIDLAHSLEVEVVAEGVETQEQLEWLCKNDCDLVQGYLVGQPVPAADWPPPQPLDHPLLSLPRLEG
ncbi:MAG: PAS domain S-box protein [Meiothermus ruber]|nr:PAS domain S-box protein [Meiothermus ruber]